MNNDMLFREMLKTMNEMNAASFSFDLMIPPGTLEDTLTSIRVYEWFTVDSKLIKTFRDSDYYNIICKRI
jgi:hypothetical protein